MPEKERGKNGVVEDNKKESQWAVVLVVKADDLEVVGSNPFNVPLLGITDSITLYEGTK